MSKSIMLSLALITCFSGAFAQNWVQMGRDKDREAEDDWSGIVSMRSDGNTVAIGAALNEGNGFEAGHVRIFFRLYGIFVYL